jgi:hypothetical protein
MLKNYEDLKLVLDLLRKNFTLSISSKDALIYETNIEFVKEKVKEKLKIGGG